MARCGARKKDGSRCRNPVTNPGDHCHYHGGPSTALYMPRGSSRPQQVGRSRQVRRPRRANSAGLPQGPAAWSQSAQNSWAAAEEHRRAEERRKNDLVTAAAVFCGDVVSTGWAETVADRATRYAGATWQRLTGSRRGHSCRELAELAAALLDGRKQLHQLIGRSTGWFAGLLGADRPARAFAGEVAANIPLGAIDAKTIAVARSIQVSGVVLCMMQGRTLAQCRCFRDLALAETKERVSKILLGAMGDWSDLRKFAPAQ
jgi:hypothetical protein